LEKNSFLKISWFLKRLIINLSDDSEFHSQVYTKSIKDICSNKIVIAEVSNSQKVETVQWQSMEEWVNKNAT
jgi:hypothetical protein